MDAEHFRPKGSVAERDDHPGYFRLAYAWTDLNLPCQNCNRRLKHQRLLRIREARDMMNEFGALIPDPDEATLRNAVLSVFARPDLPYSACIRSVFSDPDSFG